MVTPGRARSVSDSPITPSTPGRSEAGHRAGVALAKYLAPPRPRKVTSRVPNAADTCSLVPAARIRNGDGVPRKVRP
jgi:hypothetical protein